MATKAPRVGLRNLARVPQAAYGRGKPRLAVEEALCFGWIDSFLRRLDEDRSLSTYINRALKATPASWRFFKSLAPSYRRAYVGWIDAAKRAETRERRLREAILKLGKRQKLGLK